ncbi:MAG: flagellar motor switch protein, partial [Ligilactobacillus agilis]|nr:flagellar motor switch protein [Ligilactobacillus agilis]
MEEKEFYRQLSQFKRLLVKEKQALIKNENQKVADLLPQKEKYLPSLQNYAGPLGEQTKLLLKEIKELQETNLLLTKQALSFGE